MIDLKINPFNHEYFLGYVSQVLPQFIKIHFPSSVLLSGFTHYGQEFNGGLVGGFVIIEGDKFGFLGRIGELSLPESERLSLNEKAFQTNDFHPTGKVEILLCFDLFNPFVIRKGLNAYPNIGSKVFVSSGELVQVYMSRFGIKDQEPIHGVDIGHLVADATTRVKVNLQSIFGRHCAIVGTTGGGKSFTVSKLIGSLIDLGNKVILIDATGEYSEWRNHKAVAECAIGTDHSFQYSNLSIADLFAMFRPAGQVQQPILLEAIASLKLLAIIERERDAFRVDETTTKKFFYFEDKNNHEVCIETESGCVIKQGKNTAPFNRLRSKYSTELNDFNNTVFEIKNLVRQLNHECVTLNGDNWGGYIDSKMQGNAASLILRIYQVLSDPQFKAIFGFSDDAKTDVLAEIRTFISPDNEKKLLRIGFEAVPFSFQIREIVANAIGSFLLKNARQGKFDSKKESTNTPVVLIIDEAHQFLNKTVKDEYFASIGLDAFDSIAKECRKHGLFLCLSTQMPRDIPQGTLSQMGTFIVHRLINHNDKEAISNACSSANKTTLEFLPVLGEGEAVMTGVDFPMPIILKFDEPSIKPNSNTPKLANR